MATRKPWGAARRFITPDVDAAVWASSGRFGPKRVRVTQCVAVVRAEDVYTHALRDKPAMGPGGRGQITVTLAGQAHTATWVLRPNAVWTHGRLFFVCPRCSHPATRLYVPTVNAWLACRRCWGLTYSSRQTSNYKDRGHLVAFGITQRLAALMVTAGERARRAEAAVQRYEERRAILLRAAGAPRRSSNGRTA